MNILFSWIGTCDPYLGNNKESYGPILTLLEEIKFDKVYILYNAIFQKKASDTCIAIKDICTHKIETELVRIELDDLTDYPRIRRAVEYESNKIKNKHSRSSVNYGIHLSCGTPQMQWTWITLVQDGKISATLYALHHGHVEQFKNPPHHYIVDIDIMQNERAMKVIELHDEIKELHTQIKTLEAENARLKQFANSTNSQVEIELLPDDFKLLDYLKDEKKRLIADALDRHPDNAADAARLLGVCPHTFRKIADETGLRKRGRN